jgi:putative transposase
VTVGLLCAAVGISRQGYYKGHKARQRREIDEATVVELVKRERRIQPRLGARKVLAVLKEELEEMGIAIGRDSFFRLLRAKGLLVPRTRATGPRTTDSRHGFWTYGNLLRELELTGSNQCWVSDLTYVRTEEGFLYVSLITDRWSRKIVGYSGHGSLEAEGCIRALEMALGQLPEGKRPIHHSDRGIQYCCWEYVRMLESRGVAISMTEENHCYENAAAERVNGILKQEYGLSETFRTRQEALKALEQAVRLYNTRRPHTSLGYKTPSEVHGMAA